MENNSRIIETTTLEKQVVRKEGETGVIRAKVTRKFYDRNDPSKLVAKLDTITLCNDCYLEEMPEGDLLPVIVSCQGEQDQSFYLVSHNILYLPLGPVSYYKARKMAENQTTFFGRILNWVIIQTL